MFSGQGSQFFDMGQQLYEHHQGFGLRMEECDDIVAALLGQSLLRIIYKPLDKTQDFDRLLYTNPALMSVQYSVCGALQEMGIEPKYLMGYSLGELTAAVVGGGLSLAEGLRLSVELAALLEQSSRLAKMLAVFESPEIMNAAPELFERVWLTGRNFSTQFVVTGLPEDIVRLKEDLSQRRIICQLLPVNWGFHTPLLDPLQGKIKKLAEGIDFKRLSIPILSAVNGQWKMDVNAEDVWHVMRQPVDFAGSVQCLLRKGNYVFVDVGPSGTLAAFVKYGLPAGNACRILQTVTRFGRDLECLNKLRVELLI